MFKSISNEDIAKGYLMRLNGATNEEISEAIKITEKQVDVLIPAAKTFKKRPYYIRLQEYMFYNGLTDNDLAQSIGINRSAMCNLLYGKIALSARLAVKICAVTGMTFDELIEGETFD